MASTATKYNFSGWFKDNYADAPLKAVPNNRILADFFPFQSRKKVGNVYVAGVKLTLPGGFTRTSANATAVTTLNTPIAGSIGTAELQGSELIGRQWLTYKMAANAMNEKDSFGNGIDLLVEMIFDGMERHRELTIIDGTTGLAKTLSGVADDSIQETVTISPQSWSTQRWIGMEGETFHFYDGTSLVSSSTNAVFTLSAVDEDNRTLTFTGSATGCTALDTAVNTSGTSLAIHFYNMYGKCASGLADIASNTGTLWNISAASYSSWKAQVHTIAGSSLTKKDVFSAATKAGNKGANGELVCTLPGCGFASLLDDLSDNQRSNDIGANARVRQGAKYMEIWAGNTWCTIVPDPLLRDGKGYIFPKKGASRVGSTEFTWGRPGMSAEDMVFDLEGYDGIEIRAYADEAPFHETPSQIVEIASSSVSTTL